MQKKIVQTAGRDALGSFSPMFAHINDDVLFGEIWSDEAISLKQRCIITIVSLMASGITDPSLKYHLINAKNNGVTREEISAIITHAAMYAGWPKGWAVFRLAKEVWNDGQAPAQLSEKDKYQRDLLFPIGSPNDAFAQFFTGKSYLAPVSKEQVTVYNETFEPGCRSNWHIHRASKGGGQILVCIGGRGYYQEVDKNPMEMVPGSVINVPANVKHWQGGAKDSWFSHIVIEAPGEEIENEWLERVTDEEYGRLK